jgi:hypothetical protein
MARVTHPAVEKATNVYNGQAIQKWTQNSQLDQLIMQINQEFNLQPPVPETTPGQ